MVVVKELAVMNRELRARNIKPDAAIVSQVEDNIKRLEMHGHTPLALIDRCVPLWPGVSSVTANSDWIDCRIWPQLVPGLS